MAKYNFEMDLSLKTSTGIIVNKLKHDMTVLEFGCSYGRMTRYMKEALGCHVYIVEYDSEAYESAIKYAEDGICGDIQKYEWVTKFKDIKFDAVIFADVLEHLTEPVKVLKSAGNMLAEGGKAIISIPNITHNDIVLKAYMERIDYTSIGLLDDTHVHFWGLENLESFAKDSELYIETVEATYEKTGLTEQFRGEGPSAPRLLLNILNERKCGEVYQFLITMQKTPVDISEESYHFEKPYIYSNIYLDRGQGFNATDIIPVKASLSSNGTYYATYRIENTGDLRYIRVDPIELQGCIIRYFNIRQGADTLSWQYTDSVDIGRDILLRGNDPQVVVPVMPGGEPITVDYEIILPGEEYVNILEQGITDYRNLIYEKEALYTALKQEKYDYQVKTEKEICNLKNEKEALYISFNQEKHSYQAKTEKEISALRTRLDEKTILLGSYQTLADSKDAYIVGLDKAIAEKDAKIDELNKAIAEKDAKIDELNKALLDSSNDYENRIAERNIRIAELDQAIAHYRKYPGIRLLRFTGRILRGIKRRIKALVK